MKQVINSQKEGKSTDQAEEEEEFLKIVVGCAFFGFFENHAESLDRYILQGLFMWMFLRKLSCSTHSSSAVPSIFPLDLF